MTEQYSAKGPGPDVSDAPGAVYLAPRGFEAELARELSLQGKDIVFARGRLMGTRQGPTHAIWAENIWYEPRFIPIRSIKDGADALRAMQRNWALFSTEEHRRAALIQEALPKISAKPFVFGQPLPEAPMGSWTLWSRDCMLASAACASPFANGALHFAEDKHNPPNRAYLKLWEFFTRIGVRPGPGDLCLDLGSAPGGWTWVVAALGARVFSIDKAELAPHVARNPLVEHCRGSAFAMEPRIVGDATWLFCDVACYPDRLYTFMQRWLDAESTANMVCTIKFSGVTDFAVLELFSQIKDAGCMHLYANKHEVTWFRLVKR